MGINEKTVEYTFVYVPVGQGAEFLKSGEFPCFSPPDSMCKPSLSFDPNQTYKYDAVYQLYDDGWRLKP
jgi:hypothetical protein